MQQVIEFESSAKELQPIDVRATIQRKIKSLNLWLHQKHNKKTRLTFATFKTYPYLCLVKTSIAVQMPPTHVGRFCIHTFR